ncbi:nuclear transport factor 2 family protein [Chryseobacterium sp. RG1]|uniref:Nuclear transport factor 2 family protein n=1 Tax=Chryseobacterium tagetis TaxID=2801334 RepID=A0ABS8A1Q3_9FLAO|nr:nuclear transport factor 2 family protein [Chryseobacterium tagetis]MCA6067782.1 nuclear transport factor 2 family protein [Chryseobacterium tagetis]
MKLPIIITNLVKAQDRFDNVAYTNCFSESGVLFDEGKIHTGREEIAGWIEEGNKKYNSVMKPISFEGDGVMGILKTEISGTFPGSPLVFTYHFEFEGEHIQSLKITL